MNLSQIIKEFEKSEAYRWMRDGQNYFKGNNTAIMERSKKCYVGGMIVDDPYRANHQLGSLYNRILVKQLASYLLGKGIKFQSELDIESLENTLGANFNRQARQSAEQAGVNAISWLQPYIKDGKFELKAIPSDQVIPIWSEEDNQKLDKIIRYYSVSKENNKKYEDVTRVEVWTATDVTYYIQKTKDSAVYELDSSVEINPAPHFNRRSIVGANSLGSQGLSWGQVPFIPMWWNDEKENQLYTVKRWIDIFDITASDFANNIDDFQDVYWILKNYQGQDPMQFLDQVKKYKAVPVGEGGDATANTIEIPVEARKEFLSLANTAIYKFGQGVDTSAVGDGNITNVVIRSRYADLDLKADEFTGQVTEWFNRLLYFVNEWHKLTGQIVYDDVRLLFDRSLIINEIEMMDAVARQKGIVSDLTMLENHPMVDDVEQELDRIEEQAQANPITLSLAGDEGTEPNNITEV